MKTAREYQLVTGLIKLPDKSLFSRDTGGPGGPWPPQKFSVVAAVNLYSFTILVFQNMFLCFSRSLSTFH